MTRLVWWRTLTRHVKWNKIPSHTWLPYLIPNGDFYLTMPLIVDKNRKNVQNVIADLECPNLEGDFACDVCVEQSNDFFARIALTEEEH